MEPLNDDQQPRIYNLRRSQHLGYGFMLGSEQPCTVKYIEPNGPSYGLLKAHDVVMAINGINVEQTPREKVIKMVQLSDQEIEITVRSSTYEEEIRATNQVNPKFYMFNKINNSMQKYSDPLVGSQLGRQSSGSQMFDNLSSNAIPNRLISPVIHPHPKQFPPGTLLRSDARNLSKNYLTLQPDRSRNVSKQKINDQLFNNGDRNNIINGNNTIGRCASTKIGRHSPLPQRCKSSIDDSQIGLTGRKTNGNEKDVQVFKRSNTMRPIRPPAKVMEIFEVVIKIFFEDGQTKMLPYNQDSTVGGVLETLKSRLGSNSDQIKSYFGLAVTVNSDDISEAAQLGGKKPFHVLDEDHPIMGIRKLPYAPKLRLLYRMIYPPADIFALYNQSKVAFDYLYKQSCNDLRLERFSPALDSDTAIKLAALFLVEYVYSNHPKAHGNSKDPKVYVRLVKKDPGLKHFLPRSMVKATDDKKGKRIINQYRKLKMIMLEQLKKNFDEIDFEPPKVKSTTNINRYTTTSFHELALPELQCSLGDHVKMLFLNHLKDMPCYASIERERPVLASNSPIDRVSVGDCSSSIESVPRTSDSSPLIRQSRFHNGPLGNGFLEQPNINVVTRLAQMNSMRSLSSNQTSTNGINGVHLSGNDMPDTAQTPSIESISSITFNTHSTPSPKQTSTSYISKQNDFYHMEPVTGLKQTLPYEPSPMPRNMMQQQVLKNSRYNTLEKAYKQTYSSCNVSVDDLIRMAVLPPPPPSMSTYFDNRSSINNNRDSMMRKQSAYLTPILTDRDLDCLMCPLPPKLN